MGSEHVLIYMNLTNCAKVLNMPESVDIIPECGQICLNMSNVVNMAKHA